MVFEDEIVNVRDRHFSDFFQIQILEPIAKEKGNGRLPLPKDTFPLRADN